MRTGSSVSNVDFDRISTLSKDSRKEDGGFKVKKISKIKPIKKKQGRLARFFAFFKCKKDTKTTNVKVGSPVTQRSNTSDASVSGANAARRSSIVSIGSQKIEVKYLTQEIIDVMLEQAKLSKTEASSGESTLKDLADLTRQYGNWQVHLGNISSLETEKLLFAALKNGTNPFVTTTETGEMALDKKKTKAIMALIENKLGIKFESTSAIKTALRTYTFKSVPAEHFEDALSELEKIVELQINEEGMGNTLPSPSILREEIRCMVDYLLREGYIHDFQMTRL